MPFVSFQVINLLRSAGFKKNYTFDAEVQSSVNNNVRNRLSVKKRATEWAKRRITIRAFLLLDVPSNQKIHFFDRESSSRDHQLLSNDEVS